MSNLKDHESKLYPVYCAKCGRYLATIMAGAKALCCGRWHKPDISQVHYNIEDPLEGRRKDAL